MMEKNGVDHKVLFNFNDGSVEFYTPGLKVWIQWPDWRVSGTDRGGQVQKYGTGKIKRTAPCVKPF